MDQDQSIDRPGLLRMLDANLNRAREAVRVLEDLARFIYDDDALMPAFKELRHGLRAAAELLGDPAELIRARDSAADVGATVTSAAELERDSVRDLVLANSRRATEAVRVLEEAAKLVSVPASAEFKSLRYRLYQLERDLFLRAAGPRG